MFFRRDWLRPVLTAPIVPTLGPVHPHVLTVDLFEDTLRAAVTDRSFLHMTMDIYTFARLDSQRSAFDRIGDALRCDGNGSDDDDGAGGVPVAV
ncbi:hypothetical protein GA0115254_1088241 [Streptomyces sp. Ncost-T10-10d]|nr:hypothetical protein GA0115254_1088241 [Streptomyces sp. Ncost-T10-10d]